MKAILTKSWDKVHWLKEFLSKSPDGIYMISEHKPTRNNQQNRMYWALLNFAEEQTQTNSDTFHEYFKKTHLPKAKRKRLKCFEKVFYTKEEMTTTNMKTDEFAKYFEKCELDLWLLGVYLPPRNSPDWENFLLTYS